MPTSAQPLRVYALADEAAMRAWRPVVERALAAIAARSGDGYPPAQVFEALCVQIRDPRVFALWLAVDPARLGHGRDRADAVVGLLTLLLVPDEVGTPVAYLSRGWIAPGYGGRPFDAALPLIEAWARARGARRLISTTERTSAAAAADRGTRAAWRARWRGLMAYARWIGQRGFVPREMTFEKRLEGEPR